MSGTEPAGSTDPSRAAAPMTEAEVRWRLLASAAEDYEPLFHALWEFGVPADPRPGAPSEAEIKTALWSLIEQGLVELFHGVDANDEVDMVCPKNSGKVTSGPGCRRDPGYFRSCRAITRRWIWFVPS